MIPAWVGFLAIISALVLVVVAVAVAVGYLLAWLASHYRPLPDCPESHVKRDSRRGEDSPAP